MKIAIISILLLITSNLMARIQVTNKPVDFLIVGKEAFFGVIEDSGEITLTKDGSFVINREGEVVDHLGRKLSPGFQLPKETSSVDVDFDGNFNIYKKGKEEPVFLGQINLFSESKKNITNLESKIEIHQGKVFVE